MTGATSSITVATDPNESIDLARGADPGLQQQFLKDWPRADIHRLRLDHRHTKTLATLAEGLTHHDFMTGLIETVQIAIRPEGRPYILKELENKSGDMAAYVEESAQGLLRQGYVWEDMACICRDPSLIDVVRSGLEGRAIPHTVLGDPELYQTRRTRRIIALLTWVLNARDQHAFYTGAFTGSDPHQQVANAQTTARIFQIALERGIDPVQAAEQQAGVFSPDSLIHRDLRQVIDARNDLDHMLEDPAVSPPAVFRRATHLLQDAPSPELDQFLSRIEATPGRDWDTPRQRLSRSLDQLHPDLYPGPMPRPEGVTLGTIHECQGLQWRVVFLVGADHISSTNEGRSREEDASSTWPSHGLPTSSTF